MALPTGLFTMSGAGITASGGAYSYEPGSVLPNYFAGTFFIDTGYDDPGAWAAGLEAAEIYGARAYGASGTISPGLGAGTYTGKWQITASAVWSSKFWVTPHGNTIPQQRVFIKCDVWLAEPVSLSPGAWQRLESVDWTLYRL
jgi:hypothetical protein